MTELVTIYCPKCGRRVSSWDGKSSITVEANCKKCRKRIVFNADTMQLEAKNIPPRPCSSGKTFY